MWIKIKSGIERVLGKTLSNGVYFARDGYFIEHKSNADIDAELLEKNIGFLEGYVLGMGELEGVNALAAIAPTASLIHADKLPAFNDEYDWSAMLERVKEATGDGFVDLASVLSQHKDEYIYYRTDHHWTTDGAYYAYCEIARRFGFDPLDITEFERVVLSEDFFGTVIARVNASASPDTIVGYEPKSEQTLAVDFNMGMKKSDTLYAPEKLDTRDKYAYFLGGNDALVQIDTGLDNGRTLLLAKDSYANCLVPFLAAHFERIYVVDLRYFNFGLVEYAKTLENITDSLVLYNASGFASDRYVFKLAR